MKIVLATGIYPPAIGGPATYVRGFAEHLTQKGHQVVVVTYGEIGRWGIGSREEKWEVVWVRRSFLPLFRWLPYVRALQKHAFDADVVYAFSSVSCGVPLRMARLTHPKKILRLGGDFFWERFTDRGGTLGLRSWYESGAFLKDRMEELLMSFDHLVFSSHFQKEIYERHYRALPAHSVIENPVPAGEPTLHKKHHPLRLLFLGRFVEFKNLRELVKAIPFLPDVSLTLVGEGPMRLNLKSMTAHMSDRVTFRPTVHGEEKKKIFDEHDLLILPSVTEISPNTALEARAAGLPVLLTEETGLSGDLRRGMTLDTLSSFGDIERAVRRIQEDYQNVAARAAEPPTERSWGTVTQEHLSLLQSLQ